MPNREYCSRHSVHYAGSRCLRCEAEDRHRELLSATEESMAETVRAMRESDHRRANPGEYKCPHCLYITLRYEAWRCSQCHGEVGYDYWVPIRAHKLAQAEEEAAALQVAAERRVAAQRAAAEKEAAARAEWERTAPERARRRRVRSAGAVVTGLAVGIATSLFLGYQVAYHSYLGEHYDPGGWFVGLFWGVIAGSATGIVGWRKAVEQENFPRLPGGG